MVVYPLHDFLKPIKVMDPVEVGDVETKNSVNSLQMANAAAASLQKHAPCVIAEHTKKLVVVRKELHLDYSMLPSN